MRLHKIIVIISSILAAISLVVIFTIEKGTIQNVVIGFFSSILVSFILSLTQYFHEKKMYLESLYSTTRDIYVKLISFMNFLNNNTSYQKDYDNSFSSLDTIPESTLSVNFNAFSPFCRNNSVTKSVKALKSAFSKIRSIYPSSKIMREKYNSYNFGRIIPPYGEDDLSDERGKNLAALWKSIKAIENDIKAKIEAITGQIDKEMLILNKHNWEKMQLMLMPNNKE